MSVSEQKRENKPESRGQIWIRALTGQDGEASGNIRSVIHATAALGEGTMRETARFIAVVPDPQNHFPRARQGEVGLEEGWMLARVVRDTMAASAAVESTEPKQAIIAIVDVSSQAYGRREELMGVHMACAAAANAYADARLAGHPVIALIVGKAMSGAFLAHGYQANRIIALDDPGVLIHAMGQAAAARVTRRTVEELTELGSRIPPMSYDVKNYAKLGILSALLEGIDPDHPDDAARALVQHALFKAIAETRASGETDLSNRYASPEAHALRQASIEVRRRLAEQW